MIVWRPVTLGITGSPWRSKPNNPFGSLRPVLDSAGVEMAARGTFGGPHIIAVAHQKGAASARPRPRSSWRRLGIAFSSSTSTRKATPAPGLASSARRGG